MRVHRLFWEGYTETAQDGHGARALGSLDRLVVVIVARIMRSKQAEIIVVDIDIWVRGDLDRAERWGDTDRVGSGGGPGAFDDAVSSKRQAALTGRIVGFGVADSEKLCFGQWGS
jgi:hypothetical protein